MQFKSKYVAILFAFLFLFLLGGFHVFAQTETPTPTLSVTPTPDKSAAISDLQNQINEYQKKVVELQGQSKTLNSQIGIMDSQIKLTELRIKDAEEKIKELQKDIEIAKGKVENLEHDIDSSTKALVGRISAVYQVGTINPWEVFLSANTIDDVFSRLKYLKIIQIYDKRKVYAAEQAKNDYNNQKQIFEDKEAEAQALSEKLEDYNTQLAQDKKSKQALLAETQGSEARYQKLLQEARAEYEAIQGIVSGRGTEGEVGPVNQGDTVATIIQGSSCNSSGTHLHFTVSRNGATENPFNYLKSVDHSNDSGGDPFNPSGSWEWPISTPIQFNQGYGDTWYVRTYHFYPMHNGIDISSSSLSVRAVKSGTLFQGSYTGNGGCRLRYVRVHHNDDGLDTFYLHVNYVH